MPLFGNSGKFFGRKAPPENTTTPAPAALPVEELLARWQTESIGDHPLQIFEPAGQASPEGCVLFLHGHGRQFLNENATFTQLLQQHNLVAVCPDGRRSWWMNRICHEFSPDVTPQDWLLETVTPWIEQRFGITPPHVAPMGVSMGGQGALQLSFRDATRYPVVAAIAPAIDFHQLHGHGLPLDDMYESVEDARQETVVLNLHPLAWPRHQWFCCDPDDTEWFDGAVRLGMKLSSSGILHERDLDTRGGGHTWDYFNRMAAAAFAHIVRGSGCLRENLDRLNRQLIRTACSPATGHRLRCAGAAASSPSLANASLANASPASAQTPWKLDDGVDRRAVACCPPLAYFRRKR